MNRDGIENAIAQWRGVLGEARMLVGEGCAAYSRCTMANPRLIPAVLRPESEAQISDIVHIAAANRVPLYPISTGNNWGYGSANPVTDDCVIVDLSGMTAIRMADAQLGMVTVQPGVTTQQLYDFIQRESLPFLVPVTGAGPDCSIVGNALERGYGITPVSDHFAAVLGLRAVLADGSVYQSSLAETGYLHKWGVGPYLDGLFTQGNFGIVTEMTIALAPKPEKTAALLFEVNEEKLDDCIDAVRQLMNSFPGMIGGINLMNRLRVQAMMGERKKIPAWTGFATLYISNALWPVFCQEIRKVLAPHSQRLLFLTRGKSELLHKAAALVPGRAGRGLHAQLKKLLEAQDLVEGKPINTALRMAYTRSGRLPENEQYNPARDGCGLIWYAPLVPMKAQCVRDYIAMVEDICPRYGIDPLITLSTLNNRCFDSTVPLLFDRATDSGQAMQCYRALLAAGKEKGFLPYRLNVEVMPEIVNASSAFWSLVKTLKNAADPHNIIAPGRYCPL